MLLSQSNQSGPSSKGPNDSRLEDALIEYLDTNQTQIHWYVVICNLKQMGERIGYWLYHIPLQMLPLQAHWVLLP